MIAVLWLIKKKKKERGLLLKEMQKVQASAATL